MALKYQASERSEFILSDVDRELFPVRVKTDLSVPGELKLTLDYFDESWSVVFKDIDDRPAKAVIGEANLVDLFDAFMVQNDIPSFREPDLHNCLVLIKDFYSIVASGRDVSCWRSVSDNPPRTDGRYCLGRFEGNQLAECLMADYANGTWAVNADPIERSAWTHWYSDVSQLFYRMKRDS